MTTYTVKDARSNLAEIIEKVSNTGEEVIVTKYGKPRIKISPVKETNSKELRIKALEETFGMWKDRDVSEFERKQSRYGKIFD